MDWVAILSTDFLPYVPNHVSPMVWLTMLQAPTVLHINEKFNQPLNYLEDKFGLTHAITQIKSSI